LKAIKDCLKAMGRLYIFVYANCQDYIIPIEKGTHGIN